MMLEKLSMDIARAHGLTVSRISTKTGERVCIEPITNDSKSSQWWEFESKEHAEIWLHGWQACYDYQNPSQERDD